ncbi:MAG: DNA polymerase III subunit delta [Treponema sp.]|jgi:DNA polymerase-3 subunit delta|nr:DNA polymerase III subunit delta [Treponema sp.]
MNKKNNSWLFLGPEIGEKQAAIDEIRKNLSVNGSFEENVYYAGETPVPAMVSAMMNGSLFADTKLFFIKCAEVFKKKEDIELLSSCLASPSNDTFFILISEETNVAKGLEKSIPEANKKTFWELSDSRKSEWVQSFFKQKGFRISRDGLDTILEIVENNTAALKQECSRLSFFLDKNREISSEEAEKWLSHTREESAFTLFSRIAAGDFSRSLESSRMLLAKKETPPGIFALLATCFRKLMNYIALKEAGVRDDWEYRKIGVTSPGAKRDYAAAANLYDLIGAETCLALTAEYDLLIRSSYSFPEQILMDKYLYKIHSCVISK